VREAGKSLPNAIAEVREAIDFLRYYAEQARARFQQCHRPLGVVTCISPWNFPLAIFIGQVAAALVAGNPVLAKPAEETPLIAAQGVRLLHAAGVPTDVLQLLPGDGASARLWSAAPETMAVMFTGSTEVARLIQTQLAKRLLPASGSPIPLIAETGGQNAMIVDSSALAEQVVATSSRPPSTAPASAARRCAYCACRKMLPTACSRCSRARCTNCSIGRTDTPGGRHRPGHHGRSQGQSSTQTYRGHAWTAPRRRTARAIAGDTAHGTFVRRRSSNCPKQLAELQARESSARCCTCVRLRARRARPADRSDQRHRLRPDIRAAHAPRRDHRPCHQRG
jgi:RHH-type transcriptional regulator, proline utilization regulon repressor / proline dehydrogenase / delta 1-pyrroline-5-carboxylate dehydrogenase